MALFAARAGAVWIALTLASAGPGPAAAQSRPPPPPVVPETGPDPGAEGDPAPNIPELRRTDQRPGIRRQDRAEAASRAPAPIRRADDTVVVCSILLQGEATEVTDGAALEPGTARISGDDEVIEVVWSGVRIEGREGQTRASCRAEGQQVVSVVLAGEELLDGPQPY